MLITQFDKFVNRSTQEILGSEIEQENLEPMLSTDIPRSVGDVTGVKGEKEVYYRTGNVNLTSADIGALDEDNVYNGLDQTEAGYALDARQGKVLNEAIGDKLDKAKVYNGLDQTDAGYALDARQGKALNDKLTDSGWSLVNETYPTYVRYKNGYATIVVRLEGGATPSNGQLIYTVPLEYRPPYELTISMQNGRGNLLIKPNGDVTINSNPNQTLNSYMGTVITYPY